MGKFEKGHEKKGGRGPGAQNKATVEARDAIALFVQGNAHRLQEWLDAIAKESPEKAFNLFQSVIEYHVPKLARSEHTGADGKDLPPTQYIINVNGVPVKKDDKLV